MPLVLLVILKTLTCNITDNASITNTPPTRTSMNSCFVSTPMVPIAPPIARLPTSPIKISAGGALNQRKPRLAPAIAPQKTVSSAASGRCVKSRYVAQRKSLLRYVKAVNAVIAMNVTLIASPSRPSVRFTAFVAPNRTITMKPR